MKPDDIKQIALIYFKQQNLSELTPEQALQKYEEIYNAMVEENKKGIEPVHQKVSC